MSATSQLATEKEQIIRQLIDLERYPIDRPGSAQYTKLVELCREQLDELGACVLTGFINPQGVQALALESEQLAPAAFRTEVTGNAYLSEIDESWANEDTRRLVDTTVLGAVACDEIPASAKIRIIYEWDVLMEFLADALSKERLYRYADPMGAMNISVMEKGDYLRWHFDQTDFVTSLLLQSSEAGGEYEFVPMIRNAISQNYGQVKAILHGSREDVITLDLTPGGLVLFHGRNSLHRVTRIEGETKRLIAEFEQIYENRS